MTGQPVSDDAFLTTLRAAIDRYFAAVDRWESVYRQYYRMPGIAMPSDDVAAEQREFESHRRELEALLPRARSLCGRYGQPDVFAGLLHARPGHYSPQERTDSAIGRSERGAVLACLFELGVASRGAAAGIRVEPTAEVHRPSLIERIVALLS